MTGGDMEDGETPRERAQRLLEAAMLALHSDELRQARRDTERALWWLRKALDPDVQRPRPLTRKPR
ncbi:MAG TPA: hypothetical protein VMA53_17770 [Stellaceae bacterium]|nr:hypothetical protein [Stellaceae bacterium]